MNMQRILTLDGGGVFCSLQIDWLRTLIAQKYEGIRSHNLYPIHKEFDLVSGTSGGGLIAGLISQGYPIGSIANFFATSATYDIFHRKNRRGAIRQYTHSKWKTDGPKETIDRLIIKKPVVPIMLVCYDTRNKTPFFYKSWQYDWDNRHRDSLEMFKTALLATMAAPTYFKPVDMYWMIDSHNYSNKSDTRSKLLIDGAISANNSDMCAIAEALRYGNSNIDVVSLGSGDFSKDGKKSPTRYNILDWGLNIPSMFMDANVDVASYHANQIMRMPNSPIRSYTRYNPTFTTRDIRNKKIDLGLRDYDSVGMDDPRFLIDPTNASMNPTQRIPDDTVHHININDFIEQAAKSVKDSKFTLRGS